MKRKTMVSAVLFFCALLLFANGKSEEAAAVKKQEVAKKGFPVVQEKITLKGFARLDPQLGPWEEMALWKQYEELSNIHIEWETPGIENVNERKNLVLASSDLPDFFMKGVLSDDDMVKYGLDGALIPLEDYIDGGYMPFFSAAMENYGNLKASIQAPDGHIYGLPHLQDFGAAQVWRSPLLNMKWLEASGRDVPATVDEFYDLLIYFRDHDMDGDGDRNNEIGYSSHNAQMGFLGIAGLFGVIREVDFDQLYFFKFEKGKVVNQIGSPQYKQALRYYSDMYQDGLLDSEIITHTDKDYFGKLAAGRIGFTPLYQPRNAGTFANDYDAIVPPEGPNEKTYWNYNGLLVSNKTAFVMTSANPYPEASARWADFFYSEEGADMMYVVNEDFYDVRDDGSYKLKDHVLNADIGMEKFLGADTIYPGGGILGLYRGRQLAPGMEGTPMLSYIGKTEDYLNPISGLPIMEVDRAEEIRYIRGDLDTYIKESFAKFCIGYLDIDEDWDEFIATLDQLGMGKLEELLTEVYFK